MNKQELVNALAAKAGKSKASANLFIDAFVAVVSKELAKKKEVNLIGFGKFYTTNRKATTGKNPKTGEPIQVPASVSPKFKAGKQLKACVK